MSRLTSLRASLLRRLYSIIVEIIAYVFILLAGLVGLFDGSSLKKTVGRREKLQQGMNELPMLRDDWKQWGLPFPISMEKVEAELAKTMAEESKLWRQRKNMIAVLLVVGTVLLILSKLPALGINLFGY